MKVHKLYRIVLAALAAAAFAGPADATARRSSHARGPYADGYVTAESRFGNGSVSGPIRSTSLGYEVRLPGGTWIACRRSCSETLRVETVDIWESNGKVAGAGTLQQQCGLFGCLDIKYPR